MNKGHRQHITNRQLADPDTVSPHLYLGSCPCLSRQGLRRLLHTHQIRRYIHSRSLIPQWGTIYLNTTLRLIRQSHPRRQPQRSLMVTHFRPRLPFNHSSHFLTRIILLQPPRLPYPMDMSSHLHRPQPFLHNHIKRLHLRLHHPVII
jgi:hypothetical protein